jgi:haloacid dehalogenase-like hydrolase
MRVSVLANHPLGKDPRHNAVVTNRIAAGDGANDLDMISAAGLGIAFNASPPVRIAAGTSPSLPHLDAILNLLGISRENVEATHAEDPALADDGRILRLAED